MTLTEKEIKAFAAIGEAAQSAHLDKFQFSFTRQSQCGEPSVTLNCVMSYVEDDRDEENIIRTPIFHIVQASTEKTIFDPRFPEKPLNDCVRHKD